MIKSLKTRAKYNLVLFILCFIYVFVLGLFDDFNNMGIIYSVVITLIFVFSILSISSTRARFFYLPLIVIALTWLAEYLSMDLLSQITGFISVFFFLYIIVYLVIRVGSSKEVGALEFLESINVYLLLGIAGALLFTAVYSFNHDAYNPPGEILQNRSDFIYYSFVTMTTLGYGDITPADSLSRSLSIFFSVAGQLYLTMIIAMLVGKYLGQKTTNDLKE